MCLDVSNFYLKTCLPTPADYENMWIPLWVFHTNIHNDYSNINKLAENGQVLAQVQTGMYGLPQAGCLAYLKLQQHLVDDGY